MSCGHHDSSCPSSFAVLRCGVIVLIVVIIKSISLGPLFSICRTVVDSSWATCGVVFPGS